MLEEGADRLQQVALVSFAAMASGRGTGLTIEDEGDVSDDANPDA